MGPSRAANGHRRLDGKVALVTGAARGQGEAIARLFVAEGARVVLLDVLTDDGKRAADSIGDAAEFVELDVSDEAAWKDLVQHVCGTYGTIDVLVNNGAIPQVGPLESVTAAQYRRIFEVNELGVFLGMLAVFPVMKANGGGSIVNTASAATIQAVVEQGAYTASKMAVVGLTRVAAGEWGRFGVRVNALLPGAIDTPMMRGPHVGDVDLDAMFANNPIPRVGQSDDIAYAALYLACDESAYVTGIGLAVDGGRSHVRPLPRKSDTN